MTDVRDLLTDLDAWSDETSLATALAERLGVDSEAASGLAHALAGERRAHRTAAADLVDLQHRVDNAQQLANMGDYDWHVASDTNTWSDQLYRIYGYEPQSFNASYTVFLEHIYPEDRDMVTTTHQRAYATGEPYQMIERIVRPDGEVRHLSSNGQVILGPDGTPERMRGTCIDITDRVRVEQAREEVAIRLGEAQLRRRAATEINDNVVQGLTAAGYALELGDTEKCARYLDSTMRSATKMMTDLMESSSDPGVSDSLVRSEPASLRLSDEVS